MDRDFETASQIRLRHDTLEFRAISEMLERYSDEDNLYEKNYCIHSVECAEFAPDYYAYATLNCESS